MILSKDSYYALLETAEWRSFRKDFLVSRDYRCERCGKTLRNGLQVHHNCYREGMRPWEYDYSDLQCLCYDCHRQVHQELIDRERKVPVYDGEGNRVTVPDEQCCRHCGGSGFKEEFSYLMGGLCFRCFGTGLRYAHRYTKDEAYRYSLKIYHQWLAHHENDMGDLDSEKITSAKDIQRWLLSMNENQ